MSEFKKVDRAVFSPTSCALCGSHDGPFIDTHFELPAYGHVYICTSNDRRSGCVQQMARLDHMVSKQDVREVEAQLALAERECEKLRDAIVGEATVELSDLMRAYGVELQTVSSKGDA